MADKEELVQKAKLAEQAERLVISYIFLYFIKSLRMEWNNAVELH